MPRFARPLSLTLLMFEALGCGGASKNRPPAPSPSSESAQLTLPDSCAWLDMKSALGTPAAAVKIRGFCVHEEKASVATETYEYPDGAKTALAVREVSERTLAARLKGTMLGPRGVEVPLDLHTSFTDVAYSTPHGSRAFEGTTLAALDAQIAKKLAEKIREELK
jgi:hypothetical protein